MSVRRTKRHVIVTLTLNQAAAIFDLVNAANLDGDHEQWLKAAGAKPFEIRACRAAMRVVQEMNRAAHRA